jgi:hypothetical protein
MSDFGANVIAGGFVVDAVAGGQAFFFRVNVVALIISHNPFIYR